MKSAVILISGRGSNMQALVGAKPGLDFRAVISNRPEAKGLAWAAAQGIATRTVDHQSHATREAFDAALADAVDACGPDYIFLAGFMRILTEGFVRRFEGRLVNIHPSLLPSFPGLHTHEAALQTGVRVHGCTVHFVTPTLDCGPIIVQAVVPVLPGDSVAALAARVLQQEHIAYPQAALGLLDGRCRLTGGRVVWREDSTPATAALRVPAG
jgi:phosphoribosylglycinamide formyltransferase-1